MKYYMPRPYLLYFILATIASLILVNFVLLGFTAACIDPSKLQRFYLLLVTFILSGSPFMFWEIRRKGRKDSVELGKGYIEWISYTKGIVKVQRVPVADISLFEIVYRKEGKPEKPDAILVHVAGDELQRQLEFYKIPFPTISRYCVDNGITPLVTTLLHTDVDEVKVNKNGIAIKYYATSQFKRAKTVKIPFTQIRTIDLLSPHPISTENRYYQITTLGDTFSFPKHAVDEDKLKECAEGFGIEVGSRKMSE